MRRHCSSAVAGVAIGAIAGLGAIAVFAAAGNLRPSLTPGGRGTVVTSVGPGDSWATALVLQPNGKLVAAGECPGFTLVRFRPDGSLDASFGQGGKVLTAVGGGGAAFALVRQPDGKFVAAGQSGTALQTSHVAQVRYEPDGSLDQTFGGGGKVTTRVGSGDSGVSALVREPDGKLLAAGSSKKGSLEKGSLRKYFTLVRYNRNGTLDVTFGRLGTVTTAVGSGDSTTFALDLQPDGKLVAAGQAVG
jgi:uncharacterized delta-60 repeat protein